MLSDVMRRCPLFAVVLAVVAVPAARADDWPFFRGPNYNGVSEETGWEAGWGRDGPKIAWRANAGIGASSFVVAGDRVITMGNHDDTDYVSCLNAETGEPIWTFTYYAEFDARMFDGGTASTPTIHGGHVYTLSYDGQLHCIRLDDGELVWRKHLLEDYGGALSRWKYAGSPLAVGNLLILDNGGEGNSTLALDRGDGSRVWGRGNDTAGYATPVPFEHAGQPAVLVFKGDALVAHALGSGEELFRIPWETAYEVNACTPIVVDDKLFVASGYGSGRGALFQLTRGRPRELWENDQIRPRMSNAAVLDGHVYVVSEFGRGQLMCVDLDTGRTVWTQPDAGNHGTLMIADDKLIVLGDSGTLMIAEATPEGYREISRAKILDGNCWVQPVLSNGRIFARNNLGQVVCIDVRGE